MLARFSRRRIDGIRRACDKEFMPGLSVSTSNAHDLTLPVEVLAKTVGPHHGTGQINGIPCDQGAHGIRTVRDFRPAF